MGSLDGRVVIITGAGRGIGREEALRFAAEGAKVVVNDPGVAIDGTGGDAGVAAEVVEEIIARGGQAVANTDSVASWDGARRMVETALESFGDLHVVVNNATIERNMGLADLSEEDFDEVVAVKLKGTFAVTHWAARHWRHRFRAGVRADRAVVNTSSGSGLLNPLPAQVSYASGNAGVAALTIVAALELGQYGVRVNCISPSMARTRLTLGVPGMSQDPSTNGFDPLHPAASAPVAAYLASAACPLTGQVLSVRGGTVAVNRGWSLGGHIHKDGPWSVDELAEKVKELSMDDPFDKLAQALTGALGVIGRAQLQEMINTLLDQGGRSGTASA
ncbi:MULTISPECIES: SDR family NAD(P)-dependent oxidoreductase [Streptosporangium]|uniref:NAD(P)-dependent dehydrogenase (Short-subunit alcohol dehydrogenase family) n=1 Tax=Streptosporangium brasiliense TaxID=47480 RepID=A0ABT9RGV2_9ACTN|nr:SDR family NAD(P)-dependent oxidoreductase [Streptosporangium brasiliense]MDP9868518.1 NAD(P)-dependent dehydrogenase (short-subunit alcohol dehydrogenase family) [Streptosporangium brasiliense]